VTLLEIALPQFRELLDTVLVSTSTLRFGCRNPQHLLAVALHGSVLGHALGIMTLLENRDAASALVILRSLLEASVDLFNLAGDPGYVEFMHCALLNQQRRVLESGVQADSVNPYLAHFAEHSTDLQAALTRVRAELKQLEARGIKRPLKVRERFERASRLDLYQGPYAYLCWHSHNNINILEERHLKQTPSGLTIQYFRAATDDDVQLTLDTAAGLVANSVEFVYQLLGGAPAGLEGVTRRIEELRTLWRQHASR
jgi:hypothetical protein